MMTFSIIIPVKPGVHVAACAYLKKNIPHDVCYEILLTEGCAPSQQRNCAARAAIGDILYFLDDDSLISLENFAQISEGMCDQSVAVVGGPSLTPVEDDNLQQVFGYALSSVLGSGAVCNRYRQNGTARETTDKELILCNLAVRRAVFEKLDGFNECLYPNEENEFLERVVSAGYKLLHIPSVFVFRSQRKTLRLFVRQMFNYGRGRGEQTLITRSFSVTSFIPMFFVGYLILLCIYIKYVLLLVPLVIYLTIIIIGSIRMMFKTKQPCTLLLLVVYPLMHIVNGIGLFWGLINGKPKPAYDNNIRVKIIKRLGESFPI